MIDSVGQVYGNPDIYEFNVEFTEKEIRKLRRFGRLGIPDQKRVLRILRKTRGEEAVAEGLAKGFFKKVN